MEQERIEIERGVELQPTLYTQDFQTNNHEIRETQNPYQRLLWDFITIDRAEIEKRITDQASVLKRKKDTNSYEDQKKILELAHLTEIREEVAIGLGLSIEEQQEIHAYDFAFDRWNISRIESDSTLSSQKKTEKIQQLLPLIRLNWATTLRERHRVRSSTTRLLPIDRKLNSELWLTEALEDVYIRGAAVRENDGSKESARERVETFVFIASQNFLLENGEGKPTMPHVPVGTRVISLSPPSLKSDLYPGNYMDVMELQEDGVTREKYISLTRYKGTFSQDTYEQKLLENNTAYGDLPSNISLAADERIKNGALIIFPEDNLPESDQLCEDFFGVDKNAIKDKEFQETVLVACKPAINEYMRAIFQNPVDWEEVHTCYENIFKISDETINQLKIYREMPTYELFIASIESTLGQQQYLSPSQREVLQEKTLEPVAGDCGPTASYKNRKEGIEAYIVTVALFDGTVASFGLGEIEESDEYGSLSFFCPYTADKGYTPPCGKKNTRERGKLLENCQHCHRNVQCDTDLKIDINYTDPDTMTVFSKEEETYTRIARKIIRREELNKEPDNKTVFSVRIFQGSSGGLKKKNEELIH